ncbi:MAG: hypothetical protein U0790_14410 [Isosphaeraceae bacterium]
MNRGCSRPAILLLLTLAPAATAPRAFAQATRTVDESYFVRTVYPTLHASQCVRCHSENGVASEARLEFPEDDADPDRVADFGLSRGNSSIGRTRSSHSFSASRRNA